MHFPSLSGTFYRIQLSLKLLKLCCHEIFQTKKNILYLSDEVFQTVPGYFGVAVFMRFGQIRVKNLHADAKVRVVEIIADIPTDFVIFSPFLDERK